MAAADRKVCFCVPTITRPYQQCLDSLESSVPLLTGWDHSLVHEVGSPYISAARATMLRKALDAKADVIVFIDHDLSWRPGDLLKLIETTGDVVGGTYRFKQDEESYMGTHYSGPDGTPLVINGRIKAKTLPAGFLKVTKEAVDRFMKAYPNLCYGPRFNQSIDLFNHGAHEGLWWGEDYAFCRNWEAAGESLWLVPDLQLDHHSRDRAYPGNYHEYLLRQPGGSECK